MSSEPSPPGGGESYRRTRGRDRFDRRSVSNHRDRRSCSASRSRSGSYERERRSWRRHRMERRGYRRRSRSRDRSSSREWYRDHDRPRERRARDGSYERERDRDRDRDRRDRDKDYDRDQDYDRDYERDRDYDRDRDYERDRDRDRDKDRERSYRDDRRRYRGRDEGDGDGPIWTKTVMVRNLPPDTTEQQAEDRIRKIAIQGGFSLPNSVRMMFGAPPGAQLASLCCFVEFPSIDAAKTLIQQMCPGGLNFTSGAKALPVECVNVSTATAMGPLGIIPPDSQSLRVPSPARFFFDMESNYFLDPQTGMYYDPATKYYMSGDGQYFMHDRDGGKLVRVFQLGVSSTTSDSSILNVAADPDEKGRNEKESDDQSARQETKTHAIASLLAAAQLTAEASKKAKKAMPQSSTDLSGTTGGDLKPNETTTGPLQINLVGNEEDEDDSKPKGGDSSIPNPGLSKANKYRTQAVFGGPKLNKSAPTMACRSEGGPQRPDKRQKMMQQWHHAQTVRDTGKEEFTFPTDRDDADDEVPEIVGKRDVSDTHEEHICYICLRKFSSAAHLFHHEQESKLHKLNAGAQYSQLVPGLTCVK